ncbi:histidine phosphatase family protein [Saccharopolyspora elongata]|nr:histidine phosphatase family protein [Saccharopolyspora elongata]
MSPIRARHSQAHCNLHGTIGGPRGCTGLTDHGRHQAQQLAKRLGADHAHAPITATYTTPLRRARETADIIANHLALPVGAETWTAYLQRTTTALRDILAQHAGGTVLIVGHGETVTAATHLFLNRTASLRASTAFAMHYASITRWEQQPLAWTRPDAGWRWTLLTHSDTAHLRT